MHTAIWNIIKAIAFCFISMVLFSAGDAGAIQVGKTVVYKGGNMGRVVFSGTAHNEAGYHCMKCHNIYFIPKIGAARIIYQDHTARKAYCFGCHNGSVAFDVMGNCNVCHKKEVPRP